MTRVVLVHGSVSNGALTWSPQAPLAARWELAVLERPGFPPNPPVARVDFDEHAAWLRERVRPGDHLVAHSYGGVVALLAAPGLELSSLTVVEPPAFAVARGVPAVDAFVASIEEWWATGPRDPRAFLAGFLERVGSRTRLPDALPPPLAQGARTLMVERLPSEAQPDLAALAAEPYPKLVVSGAHSAAFDAVCDVLERELRAERAVLPGAGHSVPRAPGFNETLEAFLRRAPSGGAG